MVISIISAEYIEGYKIKFLFSDGIEKVIDFESFLRNARNPMTKKYLEIELFKNYKLDFGDIIWNDFEMCFPIWNLHEGLI